MSPIDPQEHVDAISTGAEQIRANAQCLFECCTVAGDWQGDEETKAEHAKELATAEALDSAAEAFIDLQTEADGLRAEVEVIKAALSLPVGAHVRIGHGNAVSCGFATQDDAYKFKAAIDAMKEPRHA